MYEVEIKVRADHERVERALGERGADPLGTVFQEDTYYDAPHRNFAETDEAFRIRREWEDEASGDPTVRVTYKGPLLEAESKSREEAETTVGDGETMAAIVEALGFDPAATVRKERDRFAVGEVTVTLDSVDGLGEFVEVETETDDEDIEPAREAVQGLLRDLGLDPAEQIRTSYLGLLLSDASE